MIRFANSFAAEKEPNNPCVQICGSQRVAPVTGEAVDNVGS